MLNKIRDLFKVKLYTIKSETKKEREKKERERERERESRECEQDFKYLLTLILTVWS